MDAPSPFLIYARKGRYILNGNIRETIDELDRKVLTIFNKLPLSNFIREIVNHFHFKVRESIDDLDLDIGIIFNNAYLPTETNLSKIPIPGYTRSPSGKRQGKDEQLQAKCRQYAFFHRPSLLSLIITEICPKKRG